MKRLEFSEKKALALKFIEKIREGYRLTGPNNAFNQAIGNTEPIPIQQASLYQFIMSDDELSQEYAQARIAQKGRVLGGSKQLGFEQRVKLLELIIDNLKQGMNIRGDTYRANAVVEACKKLELPLVHWATVHRWLRTEHKDLQESYRAALNCKKSQEVKRMAEFLVMRDKEVSGSVLTWIKEHVAKLQDGELFLCVGHKGLDSARELFWQKLKAEYDCGSNLANDELMEIALSNGARIKVSDKFEECHYGAQDGFGDQESE